MRAAGAPPRRARSPCPSRSGRRRTRARSHPRRCAAPGSRAPNSTPRRRRSTPAPTRRRARRASRRATPRTSPTRFPATTIWLVSLVCWPAPAGPWCTIVLPIRSSSGRTRANASASPPTMIDSVPLRAPTSPPDTGASSAARPASLARAGDLDRERGPARGHVDEHATRRERRDHALGAEHDLLAPRPGSRPSRTPRRSRQRRRRGSRPTTRPASTSASAFARVRVVTVTG